MKLFGVQASRAGAERLARVLGVELAAHEEREFEDGEFKIRPLESVRSRRVAVYQSMSGRAGATVNDKLVRALVFVGALRDAGAEEIVLVSPYLAFARKDRRTKLRDPVSTRYIAQMCESVGVDSIVAMDVHNLAAFENAFRCHKRNIEAAPLFAEHFRPIAATAERTVIVSPDVGGVWRAKRFADLIAETSQRAVEIAFVEKHRSEGHVTGGLFAGDVADALVIVIDDMISGGTTMLRAAALCLERGATCVHVAATHGVFSEHAAERLADPMLASVVVTDSVSDAAERGRALADRLIVLESAALVADALR